VIIVQVRSQSPVSPIEWDNVVLYGQYILDRKLVRQRRRAKRVVLSVLSSTFTLPKFRASLG